MSLVHDRFQICHPDHGLLSTEMTTIAAFETARRILEKDPEIGYVQIWDSMARIKAIEVYEIQWPDRKVRIISRKTV